MSTSPAQKSFGKLVETYRDELGLTQEELAEKIGIGVRTLQKIEKGETRRPHPRNFQKFIQVFGLDAPERNEERARFEATWRLRHHRATKPSISSQPAPTTSEIEAISVPLPPTVSSESHDEQPIRLILSKSKDTISNKYKAFFILTIILGGVVVIGLGWISLFPKIQDFSDNTFFCPPVKVENVVLYEKVCYQGRSKTFIESVPDLCPIPLNPGKDRLERCFTDESWNDIASSIWVGPGYRVEIHLHNSEMADDSMLVVECNTGIPNFTRYYFPNGVSVENSISQLVLIKTECS